MLALVTSAQPSDGSVVIPHHSGIRIMPLLCWPGRRRPSSRADGVSGSVPRERQRARQPVFRQAKQVASIREDAQNSHAGSPTIGRFIGLSVFRKMTGWRSPGRSALHTCSAVPSVVTFPVMDAALYGCLRSRLSPENPARSRSTLLQPPNKRIHVGKMCARHLVSPDARVYASARASTKKGCTVHIPLDLFNFDLELAGNHRCLLVLASGQCSDQVPSRNNRGVSMSVRLSNAIPSRWHWSR